MKTGTVKFFNTEKGFGFIIPDGGGDEIFVHATGLEGVRELREQDSVSYSEEKGKKGLNAVGVKKLN